MMLSVLEAKIQFRHWSLPLTKLCSFMNIWFFYIKCPLQVDCFIRQIIIVCLYLIKPSNPLIFTLITIIPTQLVAYLTRVGMILVHIHGVSKEHHIHIVYLFWLFFLLVLTFISICLFKKCWMLNLRIEWKYFVLV